MLCTSGSSTSSNLTAVFHNLYDASLFDGNEPISVVIDDQEVVGSLLSLVGVMVPSQQIKNHSEYVIDFFIHFFFTLPISHCL